MKGGPMHGWRAGLDEIRESAEPSPVGGAEVGSAFCSQAVEIGELFAARPSALRLGHRDDLFTS